MDLSGLPQFTVDAVQPTADDGDTIIVGRLSPLQGVRNPGGSELFVGRANESLQRLAPSGPTGERLASRSSSLHLLAWAVVRHR
jgi:hypothetical protein